MAMANRLQPATGVNAASLCAGAAPAMLPAIAVGANAERRR
jgi:hypothetical protein